MTRFLPHQVLQEDRYPARPSVRTHDLPARGPDRASDESWQRRLPIPDVAAMLNALATERSRART